MHEPVLLPTVLDYLAPQVGHIHIDGTVGAGGHALVLVQAILPGGHLYGFDQDEAALAIARQTLADYGEQVTLYHANFDQMSRYDLPKADSILLDLGVSSMHLDQPERGFSFQQDGPLDMRMDTSQGDTAADLVNHLSERELADIIYQYGEERNSRRIARTIVQHRPVHTTGALADIVLKAHRGPRQRIHPATRTFQALRIAVNDELGALARVLPQAVDLLKPAGRLAVISFHSLEDRIVKRYFQQHEDLQKLTKKPITATEVEISRNPRARSAKLRVAERSPV